MKKREKIKSGIRKGSAKIKAGSRKIKEGSKKIKEKSKEVKVDVETKIVEHKFFLLGLIILLIFLFYNYLGEGIIFDLINSDINDTVNFLKSFGVWALLIFFIIAILEVVLAPIPSFVLFSAGGLLFGGFTGGLVALVGNTIGSLIAFFIAKRYGRELFKQAINRKQRERFDKYSVKYGGYALFILRLNPFTSTDVLSYLSGITKMPFKHFFLATFFGLLPLSFAQSYLGSDFIGDSNLFFAIFLLVTVLYISIFLYGIYYGRKKSSLE